MVGNEKILEIGCCWVTGTNQKKMSGTKFQFMSTPVKGLEMLSHADKNLRIYAEQNLNATLEDLNKEYKKTETLTKKVQKLQTRLLTVRNELAEARHKLKQKENSNTEPKLALPNAKRARN